MLPSTHPVPIAPVHILSISTSPICVCTMATIPAISIQTQANVSSPKPTPTLCTITEALQEVHSQGSVFSRLLRTQEANAMR
ncbi:hypothetical protein VFPPC_15729 [Pochonia chlamydosporia 170]|uniref:Uncharacterized protein n=1 Tax=Pochonia chlamydosporia 170 TaxID=1380566 RepID=A0A179FRF2_METCM|nr:hypothetical protein VFPPC_15729 [Pochonia chlamydosporia 170]OAQ67780.1 hypothetical protein VFPPC_15729 [Pochonia chlamydosporia 170]